MKKIIFKKERGNVVGMEEKAIATTSNEQKYVAKPDYKSTFYKQANFRASLGKSMYICPKQHEQIQKLICVVGKNKCTMHSYIYNVLRHHLDMFREDINKAYAENNNIF